MTATVIERPLNVAGRRLEAIELPGDPSEHALVLLHEGLGSGRPLARIPAGVARGDGEGG